MHDLDLLVPSVLVDPGIAAELLHEQAMPHLARVLSFGRRAPSLVQAPQASLVPWQAWVFGERRTDGSRMDDDVNIAELWAIACGLAPAPGRYVVEPAHFTIANDHLRLDDPRALAITLPEARALAASIEPVLAEAGWRLPPIEAATLTHWPIRRDDGAPLVAPAIERAIGDNVATWQPRSARAIDGAGDRPAPDAALAWRRCVNEVQMLWFDHPVNDAREARGAPAVNTLWLSGNGRPHDATPSMPPTPPTPPLPRYAALDSELPLLAALPIDPGADAALESFDRFIEPAGREDWSGWREQLAHLDARLDALTKRQTAGTLGTLTVVLCGRERAEALTLAASDLRMPWRRWFRKRSPLVDLLAERADGVAP